MSAPEPHVSEVAPHPAPTPSKGSIHVPESGAEWEKKNKDVKKDVKRATDKVEKKGKELKEKAKVDFFRAYYRMESDGGYRRAWTRQSLLSDRTGKRRRMSSFVLGLLAVSWALVSPG